MENQTKTCRECGETKSVSEFHKVSGGKSYHSYCKVCHSKRAKASKAVWAKNNPYLQIINNRWSSLNQRCVNGKYTTSPSAKQCPQLKSYRAKGITIDMTFNEFREWMLANEELHNQIVASGEKSSIDRIDERIGYRLDNIQMISLHENIEKRYDKECERTTDKETRKKWNRSQYIKGAK